MTPPRSEVEPRIAGDETIDLHCHGAVGHSFDDADPAGVADAIAYHRAHGTSKLLLSLVSAPIDRIEQRLGEIREMLPSLPDAVGVHLEGPFLADSRRGAHNPHALTLPTAETVDRLLSAAEGIVRQITIAPELPGAMDAIDAFVAAGVTVAIGHTQADYDIAAAAFDKGARLLTHAFNALPPLGHRAPGPIGAALERNHVVLELIADGMHVHPIVMRTLFAAAPDRVALVTDAMSAAGLGDGRYRLGGLEVEVNDGRPVLAGTTTLAGSTLTMGHAISVATAAGIPYEDAKIAATIVPSRLLENL